MSSSYAFPINHTGLTAHCGYSRDVSDQMFEDTYRGGFVGKNIQIERHKINPPYLCNAQDFDRVCPNVSRVTLLEDFKKQYPEKFKQVQEADEKTQEVFQKWQKAYKFWAQEYSLLDQDDIQEECPLQIQEIRTYLWKASEAEDNRLAVIELRKINRYLKILQVITIVVSIALLILFH